MDKVLEELVPLFVGGNQTCAAWEELRRLCDLLKSNGLDSRVYLDFSVEGICAAGGIVFRGFLKEPGSGVLSGGQYDRMAEKWARTAGPSASPST